MGTHQQRLDVLGIDKSKLDRAICGECGRSNFSILYDPEGNSFYVYCIECSHEGDASSFDEAVEMIKKPQPELTPKELEEIQRRFDEDDEDPFADEEFDMPCEQREEGQKS